MSDKTIHSTFFPVHRPILKYNMHLFEEHYIYLYQEDQKYEVTEQK